MPPSSFDFTPGRGLDPSELAEIGLGFASLSPIYPGRKEISFSYRFPYSGTQAAFNRTIRYPVDSVRVLAKTPGPDINSTVLVATESATIGGQPYRILGGGPLNPGTTLAFTVDNLPIPGGIFGMIPPAVPAAAGALVGVALMVLYWRFRQQQAAPVAAALETDDLIDRLVALDIDRNAGRLGETEYQREREALLAAHAGTTTTASGPSGPEAKES
jgi:hypothetical protein